MLISHITTEASCHNGVLQYKICQNKLTENSQYQTANTAAVDIINH